MAGQLTCERDKAETRLTCTQCAAPICPQCLVRTPVGLKCDTCGEAAGPAARAASAGRPGWLVPVVVAVVLAAVIGLPKLLKGESEPQSVLDEPGAAAGAAAQAAEGPAQFAWGLGEEALDGNGSFRVTSFECGANEVGSDGNVRRAQGHYCLLAVTVRNVGRSPVRLVGQIQVLLDGQNRRYGIDERATAAHPANAGQDPVNAVVNPSNSLESVYVFDVPPEVNPLFANLRSTPEGRGATFRLAPRS